MYPVLPSIFPADPGSRYTEVLGDVGVDSGCGFQLLWTQNELLFGLGALVKKEALAGRYGFLWNCTRGCLATWSLSLYPGGDP